MRADIDRLANLAHMCSNLQSLKIVVFMVADIAGSAPLRSLIAWHSSVWRNLANFVSLVPISLQRLKIEFDILPISKVLPGEMVVNTKLELAVETALIERFDKQLPIVSIRSRSKPVLSLREERGVRAVFPEMSRMGMLDF